MDEKYHEVLEFVQALALMGIEPDVHIGVSVVADVSAEPGASNPPSEEPFVTGVWYQVKADEKYARFFEKPDINSIMPQADRLEKGKKVEIGPTAKQGTRVFGQVIQDEVHGAKYFAKWKRLDNLALA